MRIIAGRYGGRRLKSPIGNKVHPMSERIRGAIFSALGDLTGQAVLDAFGGSGAVGLEALSRGADSVTIIEPDKRAQAVIAANIKELKAGDRVKLIKATAQAWLRTSADQFDIVISDPPYDDVNSQLISDLATRVKTGGLLVQSLPPDYVLPDLTGFKKVKLSDYSDAVIIYLRRN